jgi:hypothetical protein
MRYTEITSNLGIKTQKIHKNWLGSVDEIIKNNLEEITCLDLLQMYYALFRELKLKRSTSAGFTGLSEYLIFRALYHYMFGL